MKKLFLLLSIALLIFSVGCPWGGNGTDGKSSSDAGTGDPVKNLFKKATCSVNGKAIDLATGTIGVSDSSTDPETNETFYEPVLLNVAFKKDLDTNYKDEEAKYVKFLIDFFEEDKEGNWIPLREQKHSIEINSNAKVDNFLLKLVDVVTEEFLVLNYQDVNEDKLASRGPLVHVTLPEDGKFTLRTKISAVKCDGKGDIKDTETYKVMDDLTLNFDVAPANNQGQ